MFNLLLLVLVVETCSANLATPFAPTAGWTYYVEAAHQEVWPSCPYRFLSYPTKCSSVDMYNSVGVNQEWTLLDAGNSTFFLRSSCGSYLSYSGDCNVAVLDQWPQAGVNQAFRFLVHDNTQFQYYIEAVGRGSCAYRYASFPGACSTSSADKIDLWTATGVNQRFRMFPVRSPASTVVRQASAAACADPFAFYDSVSKKYYLQCTFNNIALSSSSTIGVGSFFQNIGTSLSGTPASWAADTQRWAPETLKYSDQISYLLFSDTQPDGVHRIGWSRSSTGVKPSAWNSYSSTFMQLNTSPGGEIDQNIFYDVATNSHYLLWKSDDNNVGDTVTRIWMSKITITADTIALSSTPKVIMDSTGLWWVDSWVAHGSLVEGPELIRPEGSRYYYLFFASGKYCQDSYAEGVARSLSLWGPYEKMGVPLLSTGAVGAGAAPGISTSKLVGPGHASVIQNEQTREWFLVWHASIGANCDRYPFTTKLLFGADEWPYVDLLTQ